MYLDDLAAQLEALAPQLSDSHLERAGVCVLDALACVYGGRRMPWVAQARAIADVGGAGGSTVWASGGTRRGLTDAVFANSVGCHSLLYEDTHAESRVHPGTVVVPAALGVGELVDAPGADILRAVVLGYEAIAQVATTMTTVEFVARGWRASSVFGPFGAVAAAAYLYGLERSKMAHALGIAASFSSGICEWAQDGTTEVYFQPASAARDGIVAVLLARAGASGAAGAVDGPFGLRRAFAGVADRLHKPTIATDRLAIERSFFKSHPSCAFTQAAIDAALQLHIRHIEPATVAGVTIYTSSAAATYPGCDNPNSLDTPTSRQMSLQFAVAAALVDGRLEPRRYEGTINSQLAALAARTRVVVDPDYDRTYPSRLEARVELLQIDGGHASAISVDRVELAPAGVLDKFRILAGTELGDDVSEKVIRLLRCSSEWSALDLIGYLT